MSPPSRPGRRTGRARSAMGVAGALGRALLERHGIERLVAHVARAPAAVVEPAHGVLDGGELRLGGRQA